MKRIVCVEDESEIRQVLVDELVDAGYEVEEAADGILGMDAILRNKPDLVVSDISMPQMSGHELLQNVRENYPEFADMPFIFLSALADREHIVEGKSLGVDDYLTKPIDFDLLLVTIKSRLAQVDRMNALKEEQFIKIYKSMNGASQPQLDSHAKPTLPTSRPPTEIAPSSAEARILALARKSGGKALVGQMQIVGLEEIRDSLGDRWDRQFQQIRALAENIINKHLSDSDVFELWKDIKFLIYFAQLDENSAAAKARTISREIRQKVLGSTDIDEDVAENCALDTDLQSINLPTDLIDNSDSIVDVVKSKLEKSCEDSRKKEKLTFDRILRESEVRLLPVHTENGPHPTLYYADFDQGTRQDITSLRNSRPGSEELNSEFDVLKLAKSSEALCENAVSSQARVVVNVNFSTLENKRHLQRYESICASLSESVIQQLILNLRRFPQDSPSWRIMSLLSVLRRYCAKTAVELGQSTLGNVDPHALRTPILTCRYSTAMSWKKESPNALGSVVGDLRKRRAHLLLYDVPDKAEFPRLISEGVEFVSCRSRN